MNIMNDVGLFLMNTYLLYVLIYCFLVDFLLLLLFDYFYQEKKIWLYFCSNSLHYEKNKLSNNLHYLLWSFIFKYMYIILSSLLELSIFYLSSSGTLFKSIKI